jgi:hypothetical protein
MIFYRVRTTVSKSTAIAVDQALRMDPKVACSQVSAFAILSMRLGLSRAAAAIWTRRVAPVR